MRGKKTDIETKAKIADLRINKGMLWSAISEKLWVNERTVQRVISNEVSEVVAESALIAKIIEDSTEANMIMGEINLMMAKDVRNRYEMPDIVWPKPTTDEIRTLNTTVDSAFKRAQLLQGKNTENVWINMLSDASDSELLEIIWK